MRAPAVPSAKGRKVPRNIVAEAKWHRQVAKPVTIHHTFERGEWTPYLKQRYEKQLRELQVRLSGGEHE